MDVIIGQSYQCKDYWFSVPMPHRAFSNIPDCAFFKCSALQGMTVTVFFLFFFEWLNVSSNRYADNHSNDCLLIANDPYLLVQSDS